MFPHQEYAWFIGCVFNTPCPTCAFFMHWSYIAHSHLLHTPLLPLSCLGLYLVSSFQHVMCTLCSVPLCFVLGLSFIFSFISHPSCIISIVHSLISCPRFSLTLCLFLTKRRRVYSREYTEEFFLSFLYDSCVHPQGEKFYFSCTFIRGKLFHRGYAYTKGEKTLRQSLCLLYGTLSYIQYLCFVVLIASCLCIGHAYILMLLCFIECMFG